MVKFLQTFWKKLELRPTYPKSENPGQKLILKRTGENNRVIEGKTASILDLMSRPGTVRLGAQACSWYSINACWSGFSFPLLS